MNKISSIRRQQKLSQKELAEKIGVSQQAVNKYENGITKPKLETLIKISNLFETSIESLLMDFETPDKKELLFVNKEEKELIEVIRTLNPETRKYIKNILCVTSIA